MIFRCIFIILLYSKLGITINTKNSKLLVKRLLYLLTLIVQAVPTAEKYLQYFLYNGSFDLGPDGIELRQCRYYNINHNINMIHFLTMV